MVAIQLMGAFMCVVALLLMAGLIPLFVSWYNETLPMERQSRWIVAFTPQGLYFGREQYCYAGGVH